MDPRRATAEAAGDETVEADDLAVRLKLDPGTYAGLRAATEITLTDFVLAPSAPGLAPERVSLELRQVSVYGAATRFVDGSRPGRPGTPAADGTLLPLPDVLLFSGSIAGEPDSKVFLGLSPHGTNGYVQRSGRLQIISRGPAAEDGELLIYDLHAIPEERIHWREFVCEAQELPDQPMIQFRGDAGRAARVGDHRDAAVEGGARNSGGIAGGNAPRGAGFEPNFSCRRALLAIETDYEFFAALFGLNVDAAAAYVTTLVGAASELFTAQTGVRFEIGFVRLWSTSNDPWTATNTRNQLLQFRDHWNGSMTHIERHLAHFLSGRNLGGGIAWLNAVCHPTLGYALSANLRGFFPYPLQNNHPWNWDVVVMTHELGHNFGTVHTHNYCPPIDQCASGAAQGSCQSSTVCINTGTIMSYCHTCQGGMSNIVLEFHPIVANTILTYVESLPPSCDLTCPDDTSLHLIVYEGAVPPAPGGDGTPIEGVNPPFTNALGQLGFTGFLQSNDPFVWFDDGIIWRNSMAPPGLTLVGAEPTMGIDDDGGFIYSPAVNGQDSVYTHEGLLLRGTDPAPTLPGLFVTFNSRPFMRPNGTAYWVAGLTNFPGGPTGGRALFRATNLSSGSSTESVIKTGDLIGGHSISPAGIGFGYDISDDGEHHIHQLVWSGVPVSTSNFIYVDGDVVARQGDDAPDDTKWFLFRAPSINNSGNYTFAGTTTGGAPASAEFLAYNDSIMVRRGEVLDGVLLGSTWSVQWASINNLNQVAHIWRSGASAAVEGTLFITHDPLNPSATTKAVLSIGNWLDLTGDGVVNAVVSDFRASPAIAPGLDLPDQPWVYVEVELQDFTGNLGFSRGTPYGAILRVPYGGAVTPTIEIADLNRDGRVDAADLLLLLSSWGPCHGHCPADLAGTGFVDVESLMVLLNAWGR